MSKVRMVLVVGTLAGALLLGVLAGIFLSRFIAIGTSKTPISTASVIKEIQTLSQFVTVQYVIEKVVVEEDVKWFGENRVLLVAHGIVKAGVDFERLQPEDLELNGSRVKIQLPPPQIIDAYLDENQTQVIERSTGLLRVFDKNMETVARQHAVMDMRRAAREAGILTEADDRARHQISSLLRRVGFQEVEFVGP